MLQRIYTRVAKPAARYTDRGSAAEHCSACRFFMSGGDCARVLGRVLPQGWCKYFSREAVQRWNPLWPMEGIPAPPGATLDLSFLVSGSLDPRITFTRASTATYVGSNGLVQTAAANAPRWDYAGGSLKGLLIEEARTNIWLNSGNAGAWQAAGNPAPIVGGSGTAVAPDGTMNASTAVFGVVPGSPNFCNLGTSFVAAAAVYTFSIWLKGTVGGEQLYLCTTPDGVLFYRTLVTLTTTWQRFTLVTGTLTATTWFVQVGVDLRDAGQTVKPSQTVYVWGGQLEQGAFATSYIPTGAGAVTRAADSCIIPPANMGWFTSPGGSWFAEFININTTSGNNLRIIGQPLAAAIAPLYRDPSAAALAQYDGSNVLITVGSIAPNVVSKGASTWAPGLAQMCLNGAVANGTAALTTGYASMATNGVAFMLTNSADNTENMSGYMRRFRYWPRALSAAEMQQVTT